MASAVDASKMSKVPAEHLLVSLPVPCVYYDDSFIGKDVADGYLRHLKNNINWATSKVSKRPTALYGDPGIDYHGPRRDDKELPSFGYASDVVNAWTPELLELKTLAEQWHLKHTGLPVCFSACLLNRYEGGDQWLGWHSDREELDPQLDAPRSAPIASISLGAVRRFGFKLKGLQGSPGDCGLYP